VDIQTLNKEQEVTREALQAETRAREALQAEMRAREAESSSFREKIKSLEQDIQLLMESRTQV
jgi:hypothetical protein